MLQLSTCKTSDKCGAARRCPVPAGHPPLAALREEAQTLLASYERKQHEVSAQADRIVASAKEEAEIAAEQARKDLKDAIARRLAAADDHIASAQASAVKEVRDRAAIVAVAAARDVIAQQTRRRLE